MLSLLFRRAKYKGNTDDELLKLFKSSSDKKIIGEFYERYGHLVFGVCLKILPSKEEAEDLAMSLFEKLAEKMHQHEITYFKSWLYRVTQNECFMYLRKQKIRVSDVDLSRIEHEESEKELNQYKEEQLGALEKAIAQLKGEQRRAVQLFYLEERSYKEISELEHWELKKVKSLVQNAKRNLKLLVEKEYANQFVS